jgi:glycosyltransferase involved in cell wall biosynthesis
MPGSRGTFALCDSPSRPAAIEDKSAAPVSIVMATFNGQKYIADQLESLAAQTLRPIELIVSDDRSTDDTLSVVQAFSKRAPFPVYIRQNPQRLGYGENFLTATRLAIGKYIAFCDQDDIWHPYKLARCVAALQTENALLCAHTAHLIDEASNTIGFFSQRIQISRVCPPLTLPPWEVFFGFTQVFETSLLDLIDAQSRGFDNVTKEGLLAHDRWVYFLASSFGKTVVLAEPLASYRQHGANLFGQKRAPLLSVIKSKLSLSQRDLLDHRAMASERANILLSSAKRLPDATFGRQAELSSRRWQALANIYELRAALHGSQPFSKRFSIFFKLLKGSVYKSFDGGLGFNVLLKDFVLGLVCGRSFITRKGSRDRDQALSSCGSRSFQSQLRRLARMSHSLSEKWKHKSL